MLFSLPRMRHNGVQRPSAGSTTQYATSASRNEPGAAANHTACVYHEVPSLCCPLPGVLQKDAPVGYTTPGVKGQAARQKAVSALQQIKSCEGMGEETNDEGYHWYGSSEICCSAHTAGASPDPWVWQGPGKEAHIHGSRSGPEAGRYAGG